MRIAFKCPFDSQVLQNYHLSPSFSILLSILLAANAYTSSSNSSNSNNSNSNNNSMKRYGQCSYGASPCHSSFYSRSLNSYLHRFYNQKTTQSAPTTTTTATTKNLHKNSFIKYFSSFSLFFAYARSP